MASPLQDVSLHLVEGLDDALELKRWLGQRRSVLGVDTETGGLSPWQCSLRMVQFGDMRTGWAVPWPTWGGLIQEIFREYQGEYVLHNASFDYKFLSLHADVKLPWHRVHDSMTLASLDDPTRRRDLKGLSTLLIDRFATAGEQALKEGMHKNKWTWETVPYKFPAYWSYSALDPVLTSHLYDQLHPRVMASSPEVYDLERGIIRVCTAMMMRGMKIDRAYIHKGIDQLKTFSVKARKYLEAVYGITSPLAHRQVAKALEEAGEAITQFTATGAPQMDKEVLGTIQNSSPLMGAREIATYVLGVRRAEKIIGGYLENFLEMADGEDVIHCSIHPMAARTGRMSISDPALQTLHRDDRIVRGSFIPREGTVFISIDAAQIEARIAASISDDKAMIEVFRQADETGEDFFASIASEIWAASISKSDPRRQLTKSVVYGSLFGAGAAKMAETARVPVETMRPVKESFDARFPGLVHMMEEVVANARIQQLAGERPHVRTALGRYLPVEANKLYTGVNYTIQSSAAEALKKGILDLDAAGLGEYLLLPVHDECLMEVPATNAAEILRTANETLNRSSEYTVPIPWQGEIMEERWKK